MVDRCQQSFTQEIRFLDKSVIIRTGTKSTLLPESFEPSSWSVLCGRGKETYNNIGNRRLRVLVEANLPKYAATSSKIQKTIIISSIVDTIREAAGTGGFVKQDPKTGRYIEIDDGSAKEKIGQMMRESQMRKNPAKLAARKEKRRIKAQKKRARMSTSSNQSVSSASTATTACCNSSCDGSVADSITTSPSTVTKPIMAQVPHLAFATLETSMPPLPMDPLMDLHTAGHVFGFPDLSF